MDSCLLSMKRWLVAALTKKQSLAVIFILAAMGFIVDELWMFGLPIGHILPDLSEFHITPFGIEYHHWMTGVILIIIAFILLRSDSSATRIES